MPHVFHQLYYHLVWTTRGREPVLSPHLRPVLFDVLRAKALEPRCVPHAINGVEDHVHVALEIPPSAAVSLVVGQLKGVSSRSVNAYFPGAGYWQEGYGIVTYRKAELGKIVNYVNTQSERHRERRLSRVLEDCGEELP